MMENEIFLTDDSFKFGELLNSQECHEIYTRKGSKKECLCCKCAFQGAISCIQAAIASDLLCDHYEKKVTYYAAAGNSIQLLQLFQNLNISFEGAIIGAIKHGSLNSFLWLINNDYEQSKEDIDNKSILIYAAKGGNIKIFNNLMQTNPNYINSINEKKVFF